MAKQASRKARRAFYDALAIGLSPQEACEQAGISSRTGRRWLAETPPRLAPRSVQETSFEGRAEALASLSLHLEDGARLLTLLGPPGIGKTRLAAEWLAQRSDPHGGLFCDLRAVDTASDLIAATGRELGVQLSDASSPAESIGNVLAARGPLVLVLDNFEQLVADGGPLIARWLERAPELRVLATSRRVLRLRAEVVIELLPLAVPSEEDDTETAWRFPAVRVLWDRARAAEPRLHPDETTQKHLAACARHLQGLPLALELAGARLTSVSAKTLREELSGSHLGLVSPWRDTDPRHATLERAIEGSWRLLTPSERAMLAQITVFRGSFALSAAQAVVRVGGATKSSVERGIVALREASLVRVADGKGVSRRYQLFEAIREFASSRLRDDAGHQARERHANYYLAFGERWLCRLSTSDGAEARHRLASDLENLRRAFDLAPRHQSEDSRPLRMGLVLHGALASWLPMAAAEAAARPLSRANSIEICSGTAVRARLRLRLASSQRLAGQCKEAGESAARALKDIERLKGENHPEAPALQAELALETGRLHHVQSRLTRSREAFSECVTLSISAGAPGTEAWARRELGEVLAEGFADRTAFDHYDKAIETFRALGDAEGEAEARYGYAIDNWFLDGVDPKPEFESQLEAARARGDQIAEANVTFGLGVRALLLDDADFALQLFESTRAMAERLGHRLRLAVALLGHGAALEIRNQERRAAAKRYSDALRIFVGMSNQRYEALARLFLSGAYAKEGRIVTACDELSRASQLLKSADDVRFPRLADLQTAVIDVARAEACFASGNDDEGERLLVEVRDREERAVSRPISREISVPITRCCQEAVICLRLIEAYRVQVEALRRKLSVGPQGGWFRVGSGGRTNVSDRPVMQRLLWELVERAPVRTGTVRFVRGSH